MGRRLTLIVITEHSSDVNVRCCEINSREVSFGEVGSSVENSDYSLRILNFEEISSSL